MITILGVPGVINKKIMICKKRTKSRGSIKKIVLKNRELKMAKKDYQIHNSIFQKKCIIIFFQI